MKSLKIPMTVDEFHLAEYPFGWKDEYCDGFAFYTPRDHGVLMKIAVEKRFFENSVKFRFVSQNIVKQVIELFYASFVDSVEFCNLSKSQIKKIAVENVKDYFEGNRGIPVLELSRVAVAPDDDQKLIGACLVAKYKYGYKNEIIFVRPEISKSGNRNNISGESVERIAQNRRKRFVERASYLQHSKRAMAQKIRI